jgi:hypothetical protein
MFNMPVDKKKDRMVYLGLRVPQRLLEKLEKLAEKQSKRTGMPVNVSAVARTLLQERA